MFDFCIFCHLLKLMGIYRVGAPVLIFEKFCSLFSFFFFSILHFLFFLFFFFFFFFVSLSGAPLAPRPLDIVHPCHPVATPLDTYNFLGKLAKFVYTYDILMMKSIHFLVSLLLLLLFIRMCRKVCCFRFAKNLISSK